ncbi:MAG: Rieske (2Fe-2S) protein, partial [Pseudomonadota bacterium]|nr:Rieske (2Fe-2S) protein [Pseudomonadota bacterium]
MITALNAADFERIRAGYDPDPAASLSLQAEAYTQNEWFSLEQNAVFSHSWQWVCHLEKLREPGAYVTTTIAGQSIMVVRDKDGTLRAFYNVCKHRAHELLQGEGTVVHIMCPYHAWAYRLDGRLQVAPHTKSLKGFDKSEVCLDQVQVEEFCGFVYVNLDPDGAPLAEQSGDLRREIMYWAPEVDELTFGHRLTYD